MSNVIRFDFKALNYWRAAMRAGLSYRGHASGRYINDTWVES